jgi:hypothetical protein
MNYTNQQAPSTTQHHVATMSLATKKKLKFFASYL